MIYEILSQGRTHASKKSPTGPIERTLKKPWISNSSVSQLTLLRGLLGFGPIRMLKPLSLNETTYQTPKNISQGFPLAGFEKLLEKNGTLVHPKNLGSEKNLHRKNSGNINLSTREPWN